METEKRGELKTASVKTCLLRQRDLKDSGEWRLDALKTKVSSGDRDRDLKDNSGDLKDSGDLKTLKT